MRQDTVNHEADEVEGTCGRADVAWIEDVTTSDVDACLNGIFLLRSDLTHYHGVENLFSSVLMDIFKSNDAEGVRAFHLLVIEARRKMCSICAQTSGDCKVGGIIMIVWRFSLG